jgi:uncharacterized membrane protein YbhN (UPF0104 family)
VSDRQTGLGLIAVPSEQVLEGGATSLNPAPWRTRAWLIRAGVLFGFGAGLVAILLGWAGAGAVLGLLTSIGSGHLLAAALLTLTVTVVHTWRLRAVLGATGYHLGRRRAFDLVMAAWPISSFTPSKSGDLIKAYYLRREVPPAVTTGCLLAERALDLGVVAALSLVGSLFFDRLAITLTSAAVLACILAFFALAPRAAHLPLRPSWHERVGRLLASTRSLLCHPGLLGLALGLTLANWLITILVGAILFDAVGASVPLLYTMAALPPALLAGALPFTTAGLGTRDSALIVLFNGYATAAQSLAVGLLYAFFFRWLLSMLGLPFLRRVARGG